LGELSSSQTIKLRKELEIKVYLCRKGRRGFFEAIERQRDATSSYMQHR
jgi:hypothetical protein